MSQEQEKGPVIVQPFRCLSPSPGVAEDLGAFCPTWATGWGAPGGPWADEPCHIPQSTASGHRRGHGFCPQPLLLAPGWQVHTCG